MKEVAGKAKKRRIWPKSTQFGEQKKKYPNREKKHRGWSAAGRLRSKLLNGILHDGAV